MHSSTQDSLVYKTYADTVLELQESLDEADQQANVDPQEEGYPAASQLTNAQLVEEWKCRFDESLALTDSASNPNG